MVHGRRGSRSQGLPQLDPTRQMQLVWDAMCKYIEEVRRDEVSGLLG